MLEICEIHDMVDPFQSMAAVRCPLSGSKRVENFKKEK